MYEGQWTGYLMAEDVGFNETVDAADRRIAGTATSAKKMADDVSAYADWSYRKIRTLGNSAYMIIQDVFDAMGISLGAMGPIVQAAIETAVAVVGIATAETSASAGAAAFNLAIAAVALVSAIAAQQKVDSVQAEMKAVRSILNMTRVLVL